MQCGGMLPNAGLFAACLLAARTDEQVPGDVLAAVIQVLINKQTRCFVILLLFVLYRWQAAGESRL